MNAPIVTATDQPHDFSDLLEDIEYEFSLLDLSWQSYRVKRFIATELKNSGIYTTSLEVAVFSLSAQQLQGLLDHLRTPEVVKISDSPDCFKVDRTTPLGNPFLMGKDGRDENQRDAVCDAHKRFLWELHKSKFNATPRQVAETIASQFGLAISPSYQWKPTEILNSINYLLSVKGRREKLGCHCAPKRCHGHGIANYLRYRITENL